MKKVNNTILNRDMKFEINRERYNEMIQIIKEYREIFEIGNEYQDIKVKQTQIHSFLYNMLAKKSSIGTNTIEDIIVDEKSLEQELFVSGKERNNERLNVAVNFLSTYLKEDLFDFSDFKSEISRIHKILFKDIKKANAGKFKKIKNKIPETKEFLDPKYVDSELDKLGAFINNSSFEPIALIAIAHAKFIEIHPFSDGNGRMGRLISDKLLEKFYGIPLWIDEAMAHTLTRYISALDSFSFNGDYSEIINYFIDMSTQQLRRNIGIIKEFKLDTESMSELYGIKPHICQYIVSHGSITVASLSREFNIHRNTAKGYLEKLLENDKVKLFVVNKSKVYSYKR